MAESAQTAKVQELQDKPQAKGLAAGSGIKKDRAGKEVDVCNRTLDND